MEINMKKYDLDIFKKKDLYTWEEIIDIIEDTIIGYEEEIYKLEEEISNLKQKEEKIDPYLEYGISERDFH